MFERVDHFSFRDDLLLRERPHDRAGQGDAPRPRTTGDVDWMFRTRQVPQKHVGVMPVGRNAITVKKLWAATSVQSHLRRSGNSSLPTDQRPSRLTLSLSALG